MDQLRADSNRFFMWLGVARADWVSGTHVIDVGSNGQVTRVEPEQLRGVQFFSRWFPAKLRRQRLPVCLPILLNRHVAEIGAPQSHGGAG